MYIYTYHLKHTLYLQQYRSALQILITSCVKMGHLIEMYRIENMYVYVQSIIPLHGCPSHYQTLQDPLHYLDHPAQQVKTLAAAVLMHRCMSTLHVM